MPTAKLSGLVTRLGRGPDAIESATDAELLARFAAHRDEAAFAELVKRHGRLVYGVCRRVTGDHHLAEDAFQAGFGGLAAKAASIRPPSAVAAWLHGVACRTALRARTMADRRRRRETLVTVLPDASSPESHEPPDAVALLDEEIARLPDHYRMPVVLCELEGVGRRDAARRLGIAEGTLSSRLAAARKALAERLRSRGVALSAAGLSAALAQSAGANPPAALAAKAVAVATPASVPASVAALSQGVLRIMFLHKLKIAAPLAALALAELTCAAVAAVRLAAPAEPHTPPAQNLVLVAGDDPAPAKALTKGPSKLVVWRKGELVMIDPDGKNEKVVVTKEGGIHPHTFAVSPDGTKVAIVQPSKDDQPKMGEIRAHLFVFEMGKEDSGIDLGPAGVAHWSAGSKELSVCTIDEVQRVEDFRTTCELIDLATKKHTPLKLPKEHLVLDRSGDGKSFLTARLKGNGKNLTFDLFLMTAAGVQYKKSVEDNPLVAFARLSPDSKRVLWLREKPKEETAAEKKAREDAGKFPPRPTHELKVIDIATGKFAEVADIPLNGEVQGFCWSPDGKRIAYTWREVHEGDPAEVMRKETSSHLVTCDPDGKNQKTLLSEKGAGAYEPTLEGVDWQFVAADAKPDAEKLAGKWKIATITHLGKTTPADNGGLAFEKDTVAFTRNKRTENLTYKLDAAKSPRQIDFTTGGDTMHGIYEIDGDDLKVCITEDPNKPRPEKFVAGEDESHRILFTLKREKP